MTRQRPDTIFLLNGDSIKACERNFGNRSPHEAQQIFLDELISTEQTGPERQEERPPKKMSDNIYRMMRI